MPLALQLHLVMISKCSKFGVDTCYTFWVIGFIKFLHDNDENNENNNEDLTITVVRLFLRNRRDKKEKEQWNHSQSKQVEHQGDRMKYRKYSLTTRIFEMLIKGTEYAVFSYINVIS